MSIYRIVSLVFLWQLAASVCYYAVFAATPFFRDQFELSGAAVGFVVTALTLGYAVFLLPLGALTDRFGERRVLTVGLLGLSVGSILVARAWSYLVLLVSAFFLGSWYGTAMPGTNKAIFDNTPSTRQNLAVGIKQVGVTAGSGTSALLVTGIASILFWEAGFYVAAASGLTVAVVFWFIYHRSKTDGTASYPNFRRLLSNRPFRLLTVAGVCLGGGLFTTTGYTIIYIDEYIGSTVAVGGLVLAGLQVAGSTGRVVTGWLSDTLSGDPRRRIGMILLIQALASTVLFATVAFVNQTVVAGVTFVILGFFILGFTGVYYSCMATLVPAEEMGGATGIGQLALTSGGLIAPPGFGYFADAIGYWVSWLMLAALALMAVVFIIRVIVIEPPRDITTTVK